MRKAEHSQTQELVISLAQRERELEEMVEKAKTEAALIISQARTKAEAILAEAKGQVESAEKDQRKKIAELTLRVREETLARAKEEAKEIERRAAAGHDQAMELIIRKVLPGVRA